MKHLSEVSPSMAVNMLTVGERIRVVSYGPFCGLRGTIRRVHCIDHEEEGEMMFLFYEIDLEGAYIREPIWIQSEEVVPLCREIS
jgi:hypothetical protein